jgi:hypothetical protein
MHAKVPPVEIPASAINNDSCGRTAPKYSIPRELSESLVAQRKGRTKGGDGEVEGSALMCSRERPSIPRRDQLYFHLGTEVAMRRALRTMHPILWATFLILTLSLALAAYAENAVMGEIEFEGNSHIAKTSGVWVDGQYVGY